MVRLVRLYKNSFEGLSQPAWMLALVMLINRSGSMVLPFLSVYLVEALHFTLPQVGIILSLYGVGSMTGALLGGWLTDKVGNFWVQFLSLFFSGVAFFVMATIQTYWGFAIGMFMTTLIADSFRPANAASIASYAKPENVTRAFSLNRMALNLGFSVGPALGGLLATYSFQWLFIADGSTCIAAALFFYFYFHKLPTHEEPHDPEEPVDIHENRSPYRDLRFVLFALFCSGFAMIFFQLFTTLPLYYRDVYHLPEGQIGSLLGLNGILVFILEMLLVYWANQHFKNWQVILIGTLLNGLAYVLFNVFFGFWVLFLSMLVLSVAEILAMPFMATITIQRAGKKRKGAYLGAYTVAFSLAHIVGPYLGTHIIDRFGFETLWWSAGAFAVVLLLGFLIVSPKLDQTPALTKSPS